MIPVLFPHDATTFDSFGMGALVDTIRCEVDEERNGAYEIAMQYPITGAHYEDIVNRSIILAKPNFTDDPQPFRIYKNSKPINGIVTYYARHLKYDLGGYVDAPFQAVGIQSALVNMVSSTYCYPADCPFEFESDISSTKTMTVNAPSSVHSLMGGVAGSLIDLYGGEWSYDRYTCRLNAHRGADRGFTVRYGKNLTELTQDESVETLYTAVYPFYRNASTGELVVLPEKVLTVFETDDFTNVLPLDLSERFETAPTVQDLRQAAQNYIDNNDLDKPKVNLKLDFVQEGFKERVDLCDTVHVYFDALGVSVSEKCIRTKWDVLAERYIEIEVGYARNSIANTIAKVQETTKTAIETVSRGVGSIAAAAASKITGNLGGHVIMHDSDGDGHPDEILIMDTDDIDTAVNVIRMNRGGIAFSNDGYDGEYRTAWNIDGEFVADFITAGTLQADLIKILGDTQFYWDAANIYIKDPDSLMNQIRIGLYDGEHYGIGFTHDGGATWQTAIDFNGINVQATGYAHVYYGFTPPTGTNFSVGDIWVKQYRAYTHDELKSFTHDELKQFTHDQLAGRSGGEIFVWTGSEWKATYDWDEIRDMKAEFRVMNGEVQSLAQSTTLIAGEVETHTSQIQQLGGSITTEVQKGLNGEGGYSSVYQTEQQVKTTIANEAYEKHTVVDINEEGVDIQSTGHVYIGAGGSDVKIDEEGIILGGGKKLVIDQQNLQVAEDGSMNATNVTVSGTIQRNGYDAITRENLIVQTEEPSADYPSGTVWIKPTGGNTIVNYEYEYAVGALRQSLRLHPFSGTFAGDPSFVSVNSGRYSATAMVYLSADVNNASVTMAVSDGTNTVTLTTTVSGKRGQTVQAVFDEISSQIWVGDESELSFVLSSDTNDVNNARSSAGNTNLVTLQATGVVGSGQKIWGECEIYVLQ